MRKTPLLRLLLDQPRSGRRWLVTPTLKSPSVREDDAVDAALDEVLARRRRRRARCPAPPFVEPPACEPVERREDRRPCARPASAAAPGPLARRRRRSPRGRSRASCSTSSAQRLLHQRQLVRRRPSSRRRRSGRRGCAAAALVAVDRAALEADPDQAMLGVPGARRDLDRDRERASPPCGCG